MYMRNVFLLLIFLITGCAKPAEDVVNKVLAGFKTDDKNMASYFRSDYLTAVGPYKQYIIDEWKLTSEKVGDDTHVQMKGTAKNPIGMTLQRAVIFVVGSDNKIKDTQGLIAFLGNEPPPGTFDFEWVKKQEKAKSQVQTEVMDWKIGMFSSAEGKVKVVNNSDLPMKFLKLNLEFSDTSGKMVQSSETYVENNELQPGQTSITDFYVGNCDQCQSLQVKLAFNEN